MRKILFLSLLLLSSVARAERAGTVGAGVIIGDPFGPTLKYWTANQQAIDIGLGFDNDPVLYADYLWHNFQLIPSAAGVKIAPYIGVGPRFQFRRHDDDTFGFRVPLGVTFFLPQAPIELYAELVPVFQVSPNTDGNLDGGVGIRIYFAGPPGWKMP